jgi:hypothetical protein
MTRVIRLPDNFIGKEDRDKLESYAGHTIARGRATRWSWGKCADGDDRFEIHTGGADDRLAVTVSRNREQDAFYVCDAAGRLITTGPLDHVFAELEDYFIRIHGERPDTPA